MYEYEALITNIVDGDTIDAEIDLGFHMKAKLRLRLLGVNCPEKLGPTAKEGLIAKMFTTEYLLDRIVKIKTHKSDAFGRWLAEVFIEDRSFNQMLLDKGLAVPYK